MKYEKPKCDCNNYLVMYQEVVYNEQSLITKSGNRSKKRKMITPVDYLYYERLHCNNCHSEFELKYDKLNRAIRGDKF